MCKHMNGSALFPLLAVTDGYFVPYLKEGENLVLRYVELLVMVVAVVSVTASSLTILVSMAMSKKLRTAIDIVFSQTIVGLQLLAPASLFRVTYSWSTGYKQSLVPCIVSTVITSATYNSVCITYLTVVIMQALVVKKGLSTFTRLVTPRRSYMILAAVWSLSTLASCATLVNLSGNRAVHVYSVTYRICGIQLAGSNALMKAEALEAFIVTAACLIGVSICYFIIVRTFCNQVKVQQQPTAKDTRDLSKDRKTKLSEKSQHRVHEMILRVFVLMLAFILSSAPLAVMKSIDVMLCINQKHSYRQLGCILLYVGYAVFPPAHILTNKLRRKACHLFLTGQYRKIQSI